MKTKDYTSAKREYNAKWYKKNKERLSEKSKHYYEENKDVLLEKQKSYNEDRKDLVQAYQQTYRELHKVERTSYLKDYYQANKESVAKYQRERRAANPAVRIMESIRSRQGKVLKGKISTTQGLGCGKDFLKEYIESLWIEGMSWDNYGHGRGNWVIDHIIPLDSAQKTESNEWDSVSDYNKKLVHYTNLQPLWFIDNSVKSNKIVASDQIN